MECTKSDEENIKTFIISIYNYYVNVSPRYCSRMLSVGCRLLGAHSITLHLTGCAGVVYNELKLQYVKVDKEIQGLDTKNGKIYISNKTDSCCAIQLTPDVYRQLELEVILHLK